MTAQNDNLDKQVKFYRFLVGLSIVLTLTIVPLLAMLGVFNFNDWVVLLVIVPFVVLTYYSQQKLQNIKAARRRKRS